MMQMFIQVLIAVVLFSCSQTPALAMTLFRSKPPAAEETPTPLPPVVVTPTPTPAPQPTPTPGPKPDAAAARAKIESLAVAQSGCTKHYFTSRGYPMPSYLKGMGLVYAVQLCNNLRSDVVLTRRPPIPGKSGDVLNHYAASMKAKGLSGDPYLRQVYTILVGLGMRESSGRYCCGRDASASNVSENAAEAGIMQTSWDSQGFSSELAKIFERHRSDSKHCFTDVFKRDVKSGYCATQSRNWGNPKATGYAFQKRQKECPGLAVEYAAHLVRYAGGAVGHYGPLRRYEAENVPACATMLSTIEKYIEENPAACEVL